MRKLTKLQLACVVLMATILGAGNARAFNTSIYATQSRLATGKWIKVTIPESGMYEITYDELREMGFDNPAQVHVYGVGGNRISEQLNGSHVDDLQQVPILRTDDKICFYGNGPVAFSISDYNTTPHFTRVFNPYSQVGCYFLTEESTADLTPAKKTVVTVSSYVNHPSSMGYFYHERELVSMSSSGKDMLGENFAKSPVLIDYYLPHLADSTVVVQSVIAANATEVSYANAVLHSGEAADTTSYTVASSRIYKPSNSTVMYNVASPYGRLKLSEPDEHGQFEPYLRFTTESGSSLIARLDYFILSYQHENILDDAPASQLVMGYGVTRGTERFMLPGAPASTVVWYINNTRSPMLVTTNAYNDDNGSGLCFFSAPASYSSYVAFDPAKTLKKISSHEPVPNQNLHGVDVPHLLIITPAAFSQQAERLADLHRAVDGIDVVVATQDQVFNEFSSGTRDGMAYRLLCKMLYDRDKSKFKNLLLFGTGSFDNRELMGSHPNDLLTYQSDNSNYENLSYTSDDFFGLLDDNSGTNIANDKLRIGVGRITCTDVEEASSDVDKIVEYYANPDYGVWRNNTLVMSDEQDKGLYTFQGQGYKNMIDNQLKTGMNVNTVHNAMYPRSTTQPKFTIDHKTATEAKLQITRQFKSGTYFATYVGHAGAVSFTKTNKMWTTGDVSRTTYPHLPIMSTACCNVAHYDNDSRGIAELMFHKRDGGAIALLTSSRQVYAGPNDQLNQYFINALFSYDSRGVMPTLGEAYMQAKLGFTAADVNKMSFFLLGDPAMRVNYPVSRFQITSIGGTDMTDTTCVATISPLGKFEIKAQVLDAQGNLDTSFDGDATVTLYDRQRQFTTLTFKVDGEYQDRDIYYDRPQLAQVTGRVVGGLFTGEMIAPKSPLALDEDVLLRVYAHQDGTDRMVNGFTSRLTMLAYNDSLAISDNQPPVITAMFINDEAATASGAVVAPGAVLYISASDNEGINMQSVTSSGSMKLQLDGGKQSFGEVVCYATVADGGRAVDIALPLPSLTEGMHSLTYTVYDLLGNSASHTITFMVGQQPQAHLVADGMPAVLGSEVHFDVKADFTPAPPMVVRVTDATGKLVWMTQADTFPVTWNMTDLDGNQVPAGLYRYFGTYYDGVNYGGTAINKLIVLDPVKRESTGQ